ncbi:MAG: MFS transporter, partial [Deltaproteobacteria bacterium]|nr:MFS transporter [Deltaproteobacteria bacterium]
MNKRIFGTLFFSIFATVTGVGIVVPLLPIYARDLGAGGLYIGLIFGAFSISRSVFLPYFGSLSDRKGRKPFIVIGLFFYVLASLAFMGFDDVESLIVIRFLQGIASAMIMPVCQAYVGDITPRGKEGFSMGLFNMSVFIGLSIGPLAGGFINDRFSLNGAFLAMGVLATVGFLLGLFLLPPTHTERAVRNTESRSGWRRLLTDIDIMGLFVFRFAYTICIGMIWAFLPVYADMTFSVTSAEIGLLVMLGVFTSGLITIPMGALADRFNKLILVLAGGAVVVYAVYSLCCGHDFWSLFRANVLFGLGGGIAMPALMALAVIAGNQTEAMGSVMALL